MARRALYILLAVLTLQLSWNVVTAYCTHESGRAAMHFGHHEHMASADEVSLAAADQPHPVKVLTVHDAHCTSHAHVSIAVPEPIEPPALADNSTGAVGGSFESPASIFPSPPERPQWAGRA